jgi:hypothetical protein
MPKDMKKPKGEEDDQETPSLELALTWIDLKGDKTGTKAKNKTSTKKKASKKKTAPKKAALDENSVISPEKINKTLDTGSR